jgi:hypothetical protein
MSKHKHFFLVKISGDQTIRLGVRVRDAKTSVTLSRQLADLMAGTEGLSVTCANAVCALRLNGKAFPHPIYMAEFTDRRAYFVDRLNKRGQPISCVRYAHEQGAFQKEFDEKGKQRLAKMSGIEKDFTLFPPPKKAPAGQGVTHSQTRGNTYAQNRQKAIARAIGRGTGAIARARRAGINLDIRGAA